ncbi:FDLD family class I lanthipeptide [Crossiella sp. NPDC003009]
MDAFDLDAKVTTPAGHGQAQPLTVTSVLTRTICTRTPVCSKQTCRCTMVPCTSACRQG